MKAAQLKSIGAILKIAEFYEKGIVLEQSYQKAFAAYIEAEQLGNSTGKEMVRKYYSNRCPHCHAFYTKTVVKKLFGEKTICSACKKNYYL